MSQKEENVEKSEMLLDTNEKITLHIDENDENDDVKHDVKYEKDDINVDNIKKYITKKSKNKDKINDEEFNKRVKEIMQAGQEIESESESESESRSDSQSTYSYASTCSTCRSDSTHYHI